MFKKPSEIDAALDNLILTLLSELDTFGVSDEDFTSKKKSLIELMKLRESNKPKQLSPDALLAAGVNLAGILAILHHEQVNVIASKALGFVMKLR